MSCQGKSGPILSRLAYETKPENLATIVPACAPDCHREPDELRLCSTWCVWSSVDFGVIQCGVGAGKLAKDQRQGPGAPGSRAQFAMGPGAQGLRAQRQWRGSNSETLAREAIISRPLSACLMYPKYDSVAP